MKHKEFKSQLEAIPNLELAEKAQSTLSKLRSTGGKSFIMTDPPTLDDTDMIFSEVIKRFELLCLYSFPKENFCKVCNIPTDGKKCYSNRCPI